MAAFMWAELARRIYNLFNTLEQRLWSLAQIYKKLWQYYIIIVTISDRILMFVNIRAYISAVISNLQFLLNYFKLTVRQRRNVGLSR